MIEPTYYRIGADDPDLAERMDGLYREPELSPDLVRALAPREFFVGRAIGFVLVSVFWFVILVAIGGALWVCLQVFDVVRRLFA